MGIPGLRFMKTRMSSSSDNIQSEDSINTMGNSPGLSLDERLKRDRWTRFSDLLRRTSAEHIGQYQPAILMLIKIGYGIIPLVGMSLIEMRGAAKLIVAGHAELTQAGVMLTEKGLRAWRDIQDTALIALEFES